MGLFSSEVLADMAGGIMPAAPTGYSLPTQFPPISKAKRISLDFETHDPDLHKKGPGWRRDAYPVGISIAAEWKDGTQFAEYFPLKHRTGPNLEPTKVYEWLSDNLEFYNGEIVGANLMYDVEGLNYQGVLLPFAKFRDVQWAEALLDEEARSYQLETIAQKWLGEGKKTDHLKELYGPDYHERFREMHPAHVKLYGVGDVTLPLRILDAQIKQLRKEKLEDLFHLESRLLSMLLYMRKMGQRVDLKHANHLGEMMIAKRDEALKKASKLSGIPLNEHNFQKPTVIAEAMRRLNLNFPTTPTGLPSIQDEWLIDNGGEFGEELATANKCEKAFGTFVTGYITDYEINSRIHCEFHPLRKTSEEKEGKSKVQGAVSGRFSSSHPNLQNIPSREDDLDLGIGQLCRKMFLPEEGMQFFSADYSQIEFRLLVHLAAEYGVTGAAEAQQAYIQNPKTDFYKMTADLAQIPRQKAKTITLALAFCMGMFKLAKKLGEIEIGEDGKQRPTKKALDLKAAYDKGVPFVKETSKEASNRAKKDNFIRTILGRKSRFNLYEPKGWEGNEVRARALPYEEALAAYGKDITPAKTHKALNRFTQGSSADGMKQAMVNIWESGILNNPNDIIVSLTVHDELDGSVAPTKRGQECLAELVHYMETSMVLNVPVMVEAKTGANWAESH
jgi:DNA polymerase I-like protein with 3'-5' exonuclease and polymerase domains